MDTSHYQILLDRVVPKQNININFLLCNICSNILWQPEKCKGCQTHFCRFCILFSLLKSKKCPNCFVDYSPKSPDTFLVEDLEDLQIKCLYYYNGCNIIQNYGLIFKHENECIFKEITCEECNQKILKKFYHTHIILCKNTIPENLSIDVRQIVYYFKEKLEKIELENIDELEKLKKYFYELYTNKEEKLNNLIAKMERQTKQFEEIFDESQKLKNSSNQEYEVIALLSQDNSKFNKYNNGGRPLSLDNSRYKLTQN